MRGVSGAYRGLWKTLQITCGKLKKIIKKIIKNYKKLWTLPKICDIIRVVKQLTSNN